MARHVKSKICWNDGNSEKISEEGAGLLAIIGSVLGVNRRVSDSAPFTGHGCLDVSRTQDGLESMKEVAALVRRV